MKTAAVILQALIFVMTLLSAALISGRPAEYRAVPFVVMLASVLSIVALVRPFRRGAAVVVIALNALFVVLLATSLIGLIYYQAAYGGQTLLAGALVSLFAIPYVLTILAIWRAMPKAVADNPA